MLQHYAAATYVGRMCPGACAQDTFLMQCYNRWEDKKEDKAFKDISNTQNCRSWGGSRYLYPCHPSSRALLPWPCKLISATSVSLSTFVFRRRPTLRIGTRTSFVRWSPRNYGRFMALNEASIKNRQCLMEATCMLSKKECKFHQHQLYTGTLSRGDLLCDAHGLKSLKSLKRRYSKSGYIGPTNAYSCSTSSRLYCHISCSLAQAEPGA